MAIDLDVAFIKRHGRFRISYWDLVSIAIANVCMVCILVAAILLTQGLPPSIKILSYTIGILGLIAINMFLLKRLSDNLSFWQFHNDKPLSENKQLIHAILTKMELPVFESENEVIYTYYTNYVGRRRVVKDVFLLPMYGSLILNIRNHSEFSLFSNLDQSARNIIESFENIFEK